MDDLIRRQDALDCFHDWVDKRGDVHGADEMPEYEAIWNLPAVEQPEVIRCKDCKHYYFADNRIPQEQKYVCGLDGFGWKPADYCSRAERREE